MAATLQRPVQCAEDTVFVIGDLLTTRLQGHVFVEKDLCIGFLDGKETGIVRQIVGRLAPCAHILRGDIDAELLLDVLHPDACPLPDKKCRIGIGGRWSLESMAVFTPAHVLRRPRNLANSHRLETHEQKRRDNKRLRFHIYFELCPDYDGRSAPLRW